LSAKRRNDVQVQVPTGKGREVMVIAEMVDPEDNSMKGGTQFLFDSDTDCFSFMMYLSGPDGEKFKKDWFAKRQIELQGRKVLAAN
jgi:hypothetical protein